MAALFLTFLLRAVCGRKLRTLCTQARRCKHERATNPGKEFAFGRLCRARICHLPYFVRLARSARQSALSRALNGRLRRPQQAPSAPVLAATLRAAQQPRFARHLKNDFGAFYPVRAVVYQNIAPIGWLTCAGKGCFIRPLNS